MKTKLAFLLVTLLAISGSASAQNAASGNISASSTNCTSVAFSCVWESVLPFNASTTTINISGTFSATLLVEESNNGGLTWATAATLSSAGTTTYSVNGFTDIRVRCSAYVSGTAAISISTGLNTGLQGPPGPAGSGGGITQVSSLPATCTVGTSVFLTVATQGFPSGQYNCVATNTFSFVGTNTGHTINAADLGVTNAGNMVCDASSTNTSQTVTTTANDPAFTSAINGWAVWGNNTCLNEGGSTQQVPIGTITFVSAHTATVSIAATATNTGGLHLIWGPVEDTQLTAAENTAWNYATNPGQGICYALALSAGFTVVKKGHFNVMNCNNQGTGAASRGAAVIGQGRAGFLLAMTPDFDLTSTSCPLHNAVNVCFGGVNGVTMKDFGITGMQDPGNSNPAAPTCIMEEAADSSIVSMFLIGFAANRGNVTAFCTLLPSNSGATYAINLTEDGMGFLGWNANGTTGCNLCFFGGNGGVANVITGTGIQLSTFQTYFGPIGTASSGMVEIGGTGPNNGWHSEQDFIFAIGVTGAVGFNCGGTSICYIDNFTQMATPGSGFVPFGISAALGTTGHFFIRGSIAAGGSAGDIFLGTATGGIFDDMGENTFVCSPGQCIADSGGTIARTIVPGSTWSNTPPIGSLNCASAASPAVCSKWFDGSAVIAAAATSVVVNTTTVGANSDIVVTRDDSLGTKLGVTCNTQSSLVLGSPRVTARTPGTSFTVTIDAGPTTNPMCFNFSNRGTQ